MLKIWGRSSSSNVMKVLWLCEELGLPFERIDAGGAFGRTKEPDYLAKNPNALVPTLEEEDGFVLWESNSILRYLCNTRPGGAALYPQAPRERADVERWMDWQLSAVNAPMTPASPICAPTTPTARMSCCAGAISALGRRSASSAPACGT